MAVARRYCACVLVIFHNALDITDVVRGLVAEGWLITADQLGAMPPYLRGHISRFGAYATDDVARNEERSYLLMYLREFAGPDGVLPTDFDGLVRDAFSDVLHTVGA